MTKKPSMEEIIFARRVLERTLISARIQANGEVLRFSVQPSLVDAVIEEAFREVKALEIALSVLDALIRNRTDGDYDNNND